MIEFCLLYIMAFRIEKVNAAISYTLLIFTKQALK